MKTLEFIYQETAIHFLVNPTDKHVMVNATEMAKMYGKRIDVFLKTDHAKAFIEALQFTPYGGNSTNLSLEEIVLTRGHLGTFFNRLLALKFAAWLSPEFEVWVFSKIEEITFGNYQKHWEAHAAQELAKAEMKEIKRNMLINPTPEMVATYFEKENEYKTAQAAKTSAIKNQLKMFN